MTHFWAFKPLKLCQLFFFNINRFLAINNCQSLTIGKGLRNKQKYIQTTKHQNENNSLVGECAKTCQLLETEIYISEYT